MVHMSRMAAWSCRCVAVCWAALATINTQSAASNKRNTEFCLSWQLAIDYRLVSTLLVKWRQSTLKTRLRLPPICGGGRLCWFLFEELWNFASSLVRCGGGGGGVATPSALIWIHQPGRGIPLHTSHITAGMASASSAPHLHTTVTII